jgi:hypothetical protein
MDNRDKIVIDLCGGTGSWSQPYVDAGYTVHNISLPEYNVGDWWIAGDALRFRKQIWKNDGGEYLEIPLKDIYGILAAPPCTMFSIARTTAKTPPDFVGAMSVVESCEQIIRQCMMRGNLKFWAIENPRGKLRRFLGVPKNTFYQWQFGGQHKKPSDFWGFFNPPKPTVKDEPMFDTDKSWQKPERPAEYANLKLDRAAIRAITPRAFAKAFYEANK